MSNAVTNVCRRLTAVTLPQKSVLMALADRADDTGIAWPSLAWLQEWTCAARSTLIEAIKALEGLGYIAVERSGGKQNRVRINLAAVEAASANPSASRTRPPAGPVRESDHHPSASRTPPVREPDGTRPPAGPDTPIHINNTSGKTSNTRASKPRDLLSQFPELLAGIDAQVLADWQVLRKQKRAPITATVLRDLQREAQKAGITLADAMTMCCARGWQGFRADWVQQQAMSGRNKQEQLEAKNAAAARRWQKKYAAAAAGIFPVRSASEVIDVAANGELTP
jgi:hypothetical protein